MIEKAASTPLRPLWEERTSQAAVLPQAFEDRVHARQLDGVVQESGAKDESSRFGTLTFNMTHASERGAAARKSQRVTRIARDEKLSDLVSHPRATRPETGASARVGVSRHRDGSMHGSDWGLIM